MRNKSSKIYHTKKELSIILFNLAYIILVPMFKLTTGVIVLYAASIYGELSKSLAIVLFLGIFLWIIKDFVNLYSYQKI